MGEGEREVGRKAMWKNQQRDEREGEKRGTKNEQETQMQKKQRMAESCCKGKKRKKKDESTIDDSTSMMEGKPESRRENESHITVHHPLSSNP